MCLKEGGGFTQLLESHSDREVIIGKHLKNSTIFYSTIVTLTTAEQLRCLHKDRTAPWRDPEALWSTHTDHPVCDLTGMSRHHSDLIWTVIRFSEQPDLHKRIHLLLAWTRWLLDESRASSVYSN
jgi:hypothetical protein